MIQTMSGAWWMLGTVRCILTLQEQKEAINQWAVQKGAQLKTAFGRGCAWYAGPGSYYSGYNSRLHSGTLPDRWDNSGISDW